MTSDQGGQTDSAASTLAGALRQKLDTFDRIPLAEWPSPLNALPRLSEDLGRTILIKRDDSVGPAMGGNKVRKLEYLLADARKQGARRVVTFGGLQSNHARMTAAAARRCGFEPHLFFFERRPKQLTGNLLLNALLGAKMHFVPFGGGGAGGMSLETTTRLVRWLARLWVPDHYFIPVGGHSWLGCLGYVRAALEIHEQAETLGFDKGWLVAAAGSGGTLAGLLAGLSLIQSPLCVTGIDVGKLWKGFPASIARMATDLCGYLGKDLVFAPDSVPLIEQTYAGEGYAVPTAFCSATTRKVARLEGLLLDPVYTGKAFAGVLDLIEQGRLGSDEPIIFLHSGGAPGLFAFRSSLLE